MNEERIMNIESKLTYQEDLVEELNMTIYLQQQRLDRLEAVCATLVRQIEVLASEGAGGKILDERPPHY